MMSRYDTEKNEKVLSDEARLFIILLFLEFFKLTIFDFWKPLFPSASPLAFILIF